MENGNDKFLQLFLASQSEIRSFIGAVVWDYHQREDVFQDVSMTLFQKFEKYDPTRPFTAWAKGVAANKVLSAWKKGKRAPALFSAETLEVILNAHEETMETADSEQDALHDCVERLPDKSRKLLALRYEKKLKLDAIAKTLKKKMDAINKALSRIRGGLRGCIEEKVGKAGGTE